MLLEVCESLTDHESVAQWPVVIVLVTPFLTRSDSIHHVAITCSFCSLNWPGNGVLIFLWYIYAVKPKWTWPRPEVFVEKQFMFLSFLSGWNRENWPLDTELSLYSRSIDTETNEEQK